MAARQVIEADGQTTTVNSFHEWGALRSPPALEVWAQAPDGVIKAVRHRSEPLVGLMWHPERLTPFRGEDLALFRRTFAAPDEASS